MAYAGETKQLEKNFQSLFHSDILEQKYGNMCYELVFHLPLNPSVTKCRKAWIYPLFIDTKVRSRGQANTVLMI